MIRKIFFILFIAITSWEVVKCQPIVNRSNSSITVQDSRLAAQYNLLVPRYADTTAANLQIGIDTLGAIIYTYDVQTLWVRRYSSGFKWETVGSGAAGSGTVTNIATGLGLSGGPITTTGTILVDTASVSIISRERAAATYQPIGDYLITDSWYNIVRDGGADSTGSTDVSAIIQNAINAGWKTIFIPHGTFLVSTQIEMEDSVTILGAGRFTSRFKLTTDITAFHCSFGSGGNNTTFSSIGFYGDYASGGLTTQRGISVDSAKSILITSISGYNMGGFVVRMSQNATASGYVPIAGRSNTVTDSYFEANYGGVNFDVRAEYNEISNSTFTGNLYAIQNIGGNNRILSNSVENNTWGLYMTSGANGGHGVASNNTFNHNGTAGVGANIYLNGIASGFNFSNNSFAETQSATAGVFEIISCADITWEGGYTVRDTIRVTSSTNIIFSNVRKYTSFSPVWVVVSGEAPTVFNAGRVDNSISIFDPTNTKQLDITYLNNKTNFTGTVGNTFGFLNAAADSTVDITGSLRATTGVRFSGLPTGVGVYSVRADANGTLSLADTTIGGGGSPFIPTTGTGTATGAVTGELGGNILLVEQGANALLTIDPTAGAETSILRAINTTADDNIAQFLVATTTADAATTFLADFNGGAKSAQILAQSNVTTAELTYTADTHTFAGTVNLGTAGSLTGVMTLSGVTSGTITIQPASAAGTYTLTLPTDDGTASQFLQTNGSGVLTWATAAGSGDVTKVGTPVNNQLGVWTGNGTIEGDANLTFASSTLSIGVAGSTTGILTLSGLTSGSASIQSDALGNALNGTTLTGTGVVWSTSGAYVNNDFTLSDVNTAQNVFPSGYDTWTLQAATTYRFKGKYFISTGGGNVSVAMSFALAGGASVTSIRYGTISGVFNDGSTSGTQLMGRQNAVSSWVVTSSSATSGRYIDFEGIIRVNAGGTIAPQITFSAAPGGTNTLDANSFIEFIPIGTNTITSIGPAS